MSLLREYIVKSPSTEEGVKAYVDDVTSRYIPKAALNGERLVKCHWLVEYESKADLITSGCMLPMLLFGHFHFSRSRLAFDTYHLLKMKEARHMQRANRIRIVFLPLFVFAVLITGIAFIFSFVMLACVMAAIILHAIPSTQEAHPWIATGIFLACGLFFAACLKVQRFLRRIGRPPGTDDFADQAIKLNRVTIN